ncbi:hypothetical protein DV737_g3915, partial [Chaetothyriales sp. CBS 132003]
MATSYYRSVNLAHPVPDLAQPFHITSPPGTDVWDKPPATHSFNAPIIYCTTTCSSFKSARVTVSAKWTDKYDQGGLILVVNSTQGRKWIKTGIEFEHGHPNVSTVAKDRWADWSLSRLQGSEATLELGVESGSIWVWLVHGEERTPLREVTFWADLPRDAECWVGVYAAKPAPNGETEALTTGRLAPMPVRSQRSARSAAEPARAYDIPGFDFSEVVSWRPGKAIPVADLLSRLQSLSNALRSYDEEHFNPQIFAPLATDLSNPNLLGHKDKGDVFTVFINSILPAMADPGNAYNAQHVYILQSLSESQSIVLLADVPEPDTLMTNLFTHAFDVFAPANNSGADSQVSKTVEYHLKNLLCTVVEESELPQDVTDVVLSQFLRVDLHRPAARPSKSNKAPPPDKCQGNLLPKDYPTAYTLAKAVCTTCQEKMTAQISQYFNAIIVDAVSAIKSTNHSAKRRPSALQDSDNEAEDLEDLKKAHRLLRELWRACPDVLVNVIPQVDAELSADVPHLRQLATETLGDVTAGIGIAGLAATPRLDPAAYPLPSLSQPEAETTTGASPLLIPASPKPFVAVHQSTYENFLTRRNDKSPAVRAAWATAVARILFTAAGGIGLSEDDHSELLSGYAQMLRDQDESVRIAAIRGLTLFTYRGIVTVIGADGGLSKSGSVISTLTERFSDRKHAVRVEAISFAAQLWGTASKDLEDGLDDVASVLGDMPTRLLGSYYTNDVNIHCLLDKVLYESIFPLSFPPIKQSAGTGSSSRRKAKDAEAGSHDNASPDADAIRARRLLTFVQALDARTKQVFFAMQNRQVQMSKAMTVFLKACDDFNGGTVKDDLDEAKVEARLNAYIEALSKSFPDASKVSADLGKFARQNNRRDYQLIRFAMSPESDHRTMQKAIKELTKRIRDGPVTTQALLDTLLQVLYRCALVIYNRSHIPAIMQVSHTNEHGLAAVAHEMLKEISSRNPEVLKTHIQALCNELGDSPPTATTAEDDGAADTLKACAHFARRYPGEVDKDRKFMTALTKFALYARSPRAAKHAVSVILTVTDRKEMYAKEILSKALNEANPDSPNFLGQLAAVAQVCLLSSAAAASKTEAILKLAVSDILQKNKSPPSTESAKPWEEPPSHETQAKELALKIMVNRCRSEDDVGDAQEFEATASAVLKILFQLIDKDGELTSAKDTALCQRNRLRLAAARLVLKLCSHKRRCEELVNPSMFNSLALILINPPSAVRAGLVNQLKKYLGQNRLNYRWLALLFLLAFEPDLDLKTSTDKKVHQNVMETTFARLLSLMAHHPDYPDKGSDTFDEDLLDFSKYIIFYLVAVATENNLSLIFHIAQRIKQTRDNITTGREDLSERLYVLSDLSQAVIRNYADMMPTSTRGAQLLETWPGKVPLPRSLFKALPDHHTAQAVVEKNYLPEETALGLEKVIRDYVRSIKGGKQVVKRAVHVGDRKRKIRGRQKKKNARVAKAGKATTKKTKSATPLSKKAASASAKDAAPSSAPSSSQSTRPRRTTRSAKG